MSHRWQATSFVSQKFTIVCGDRGIYAVDTRNGLASL